MLRGFPSVNTTSVVVVVVGLYEEKDIYIWRKILVTCENSAQDTQRRLMLFAM